MIRFTIVKGKQSVRECAKLAALQGQPFPQTPGGWATIASAPGLPPAYSFCSKEDNFDELVGRELAEARLYEYAISLFPNDTWLAISGRTVAGSVEDNLYSWTGVRTRGIVDLATGETISDIKV